VKKKSTTGRPASSCNVLVTPEFRQKPDVEKLARTFVTVAEKRAGAGARTKPRSESPTPAQSQKVA